MSLSQSIKNLIRHGKQGRTSQPHDDPTTHVSPVNVHKQNIKANVPPPPQNHYANSDPNVMAHQAYQVPGGDAYSMADADARNRGAQAGNVAAHAAGHNQKAGATKSKVDKEELARLVAEENESKGKLPRYPGLERWQLIEKMGDGAFSNVYRARDLEGTAGEVAIKVVRKFEMNSSQGEAHLHPDFKKQPKGVERANILKEVQIMRNLDHPNIVKLVDFSESRQYYYIILELAPGGELFHQIVRLTYFSENLSRHVITQVAEALFYLHEEQGVVHRDIKPENLLFSPIPVIPTKNPKPKSAEDEDKVDEGEFIEGVGAGGIGKIKIADFGLSKVVWDNVTQTPCGTVGYTAPEIVKNERYSKSVDMWAMGCVLYTLLCGFPPVASGERKGATMESHFPVTAKRQLSASGEMESGGTPPRSHRRPKTLPPPIAVPDGHSAFRLLCPASKVGGVIGKSGAIVDAIRSETGSKIRVEESVPSCDERVILVVGPGVPNRQIGLAAGDPVIVSAAQEALVRVFDRILEADQEHEKTELISCRMLAVSAQVGALMGKGGRNIDRIRKESGCKVRVLPMDQLPQCAAASDELIQITGNGLGIKKALVAISSCLQDNSQSVKAQLVNNPHVTLSNTHEELLFQRSSLPSAIPGDFRDYDARDHPASIGVDWISKPERKTLQDISFRLLCSNDNIGGVIGKGGAIVRALQNETTASIACSASVAESDERVINVSASENPDLQFSPAQNALLRVFNRSIEVGIEKGMKPVSQITARLLVPTNQIGCLMGKGGVIIQEITKISGASIQIIRGDQVPRCASEKEEVVQITGELGNVRDALFHVTNRLRNNVFSTYLLKNSEAPVVSSTLEIPSYGRVGPTLGWYPSMGVPSSLEFQTTTAQSMDHFAISSMNLSSPPRLLSSQKFGATADFENGLRARRGGFGSGNKAAIVTKTTVDIVVPASAFGYVYGKNGSNLSQMRQISGAMVTVHDPAPGASEGMVIISGTPHQTQAAQSLLQSFITSG